MTPRENGILGQEDELSTEREEKNFDRALDNGAHESRKGHQKGDFLISIWEALAPTIEEVLNRRDAVLAEKILQDIMPKLEETVRSVVEERLRDSIGESLDERLGEISQIAADKVIESMLVPGSSFARNLQPLVVGVIAQRASPQFRDWLMTDIEAKLVRELKYVIETKLVPGSLFQQHLIPSVIDFVDKRLSEKFGSLLDALEALRGNKTETTEGHAMKLFCMRRMSATIDFDTHEQLKALGGNFSEHVRNACKLYLKALGEKKQ